jgi:hypothetical protein
MEPEDASNTGNKQAYCADFPSDGIYDFAGGISNLICVTCQHLKNMGISE